MVISCGANEAFGLPGPRYIRAAAHFLNAFLIVETHAMRVAYRLGEGGSIEATLKSASGARASGVLRPRPDLAKRSGTVGAVALDRCGDLAAATSTGGFGSKTPGRVDGSPLIGAGTYAENRSAAVSATGHGEHFIRHAVAHEIAARVRHGGETLLQAAYRVIFRELKPIGAEGGIIANDRDGEIVMLFNTDGMVRGSTDHQVSPSVETYYSD